MFKLIKQLFTLLDSSQRKRFYILQFLVIFSAFIEIFAVISIIPFMAVVGDINLLKQDTVIAQIYQYSGISSEMDFLFLLGISVLMVLFFSALVCIATTWKVSMFTGSLGAELTTKLYNYYIARDWLFHSQGSSAVLTKKITSEAHRVANGILTPLMQMNARILFAFFMSLSLFFYDPKVGIIGFFIFAFAYLILFKIVRKKLYLNGKIISNVAEERFRLINEGFGGIQDILITGRDDDFVECFANINHKLGRSLGSNMGLSMAPRYFMELLAFSAILILTLYLIATHNVNLGVILPIISVYALATLKLLPAFQQIYTSAATVKSNIIAFESISDDLSASMDTQRVIQTLDRPKIIVNNQIQLQNISFTYPGKSSPALKNIDMSIPAQSIVGIVGESGSGKTTLINILLGLIKPDQGQLQIDDEVISDSNVRSWQNTIGFVSQNIFLSERSISENVAFGIQRERINHKQVHQALNLANLSELVSSLEHGIQTKVGERGIQLSGGQRQRIGIARAFYNEAEILVFDEATSSLDGITEQMIMKAINDLHGQKTIILIAHRIKTVKNCDSIYFIDNGNLIDKGTYNELMNRNSLFKNLASHA